jgi:uncharacterized protein YkwD
MHGRARAAVTTAALALAMLGMAGTASAEDATAAPSATAAVERALIKEMNLARARNGLPGLRARATLTRPARSHSAYLLARGILEHEGPGGAPFWARLVKAGYPRASTLGENLAMAPGCGVRAAREAVRMWLDSPGHRANLLHPEFRFTGAGVASADDCSSTVLTADYGS